MRSPAALPLNAKLAVVAFALGVVALGARVDRGNAVALDVKEMALLVQKEADHVTPQELADWLIQQKPGVRIVDLRGEAEYAAYHVPGAESVPLATLADADLPRTETIVLYSDGGIHGAQAWLLMKAKRYPSVLNLKGGLEGWKDEVLFPVFPEKPAPQEQARLDRLAAVSRLFGGQPRIGGSDAASSAPLPAPELPKVAPPAPGGGPVPPKRGKKEGC